jgi:lipid A 4'-phosphatase
LSRAWTIATLLAAIVTATIFWIWPGIDLIVARAFHGDGVFWGGDPYARAYRAIFYWMPTFAMAVYLLVFALQRLGSYKRFPLVSARAIVFLALSMALGPGLLVNVALKDHWHRPRPSQIAEFGGGMEFRPFWRNDGACSRNCSFVSGEVSTAAWLIAPAMLAVPPFRVGAFVGALAITALTALGRLAFGGHFLSDALFAAVFTILLTQLLHWTMIGRRKSVGDGVAPGTPRR